MFFVQLTEECFFTDAASENRTVVSKPPGKYAVEEIDTPFGGISKWFIIKGTMHGIPDRKWKVLVECGVVIIRRNK